MDRKSKISEVVITAGLGSVVVSPLSPVFERACGPGLPKLSLTFCFWKDLHSVQFEHLTLEFLGPLMLAAEVLLKIFF